MDVDGANQTKLTNDLGEDIAPSWSPYGKKIALHSDRGGPGDMGDGRHQYKIYVMNADGSNQVRLTDNLAKDISHSWPPDGTKIAVSADRGANDEIYVMNADGSARLG